jgi:hypothetical protein
MNSTHPSRLDPKIACDSFDAGARGRTGFCPVRGSQGAPQCHLLEGILPVSPELAGARDITRVQEPWRKMDDLDGDLDGENPNPPSPHSRTRRRRPSAL